MDVLIGIIVLLGGAFLFTNSKRKSAESLLENQETKEKLLEVDKATLVDKANLEVEKQKEAALKSEHEKVAANEQSIKDVLDFFTKNLK